MHFGPSGYTKNLNIPYCSSVLDYVARWLRGKISFSGMSQTEGLSEEEDCAPGGRKWQSCICSAAGADLCTRRRTIVLNMRDADGY